MPDRLGSALHLVIYLDVIRVAIRVAISQKADTESLQTKRTNKACKESSGQRLAAET